MVVRHISAHTGFQTMMPTIIIYIYFKVCRITSLNAETKVSIHGIHIDNRSVFVIQYADDTIITIKYSEHIFREIIEIFKVFAKGLKI